VKHNLELYGVEGGLYGVFGGHTSHVLCSF